MYLNLNSPQLPALHYLRSLQTGKTATHHLPHRLSKRKDSLLAKRQEWAGQETERGWGWGMMSLLPCHLVRPFSGNRMALLPLRGCWHSSFRPLV